jgi:hypothetical protein
VLHDVLWVAQRDAKYFIRQRVKQKFSPTSAVFFQKVTEIAVIVEIIRFMVILSGLRLVVVDFIGLRGNFMVKNSCPPISKTEVGGKRSVNYCVHES